MDAHIFWPRWLAILNKYCNKYGMKKKLADDVGYNSTEKVYPLLQGLTPNTPHYIVLNSLLVFAGINGEMLLQLAEANLILLMEEMEAERKERQNKKKKRKKRCNKKDENWITGRMEEEEGESDEGFKDL